jgi:hypothetical protein
VEKTFLVQPCKGPVILAANVVLVMSQFVEGIFVPNVEECYKTLGLLGEENTEQISFFRKIIQYEK